MAININNLINVTGSVVNTGFNQFTLAGLFMDKNSLIPYSDSQKVLPFTSAASVAAYFGSGSDEAAVANNYFKSFDNNLNIPSYLYFARYVDEDIAPYIRGGTPASLAVFQGISSGSLTLQFNGSTFAPLATTAYNATGDQPGSLVHWNDGTDDFITVVNAGSNTISTFKFVAGEWAIQGAAVATGTLPHSIAYSNIGGNHYVSVTNTTSNTLGTYLWSGTAFALIGAAITTGASSAPQGVTAFTIGGTHYLTVANNGTDNCTTYSWTGSAFAAISGTPTVSTGTEPVYITQFAFGSQQYIALNSDDADTVSVLIWDGAKFVANQTLAATDCQNLCGYAINGFNYIAIASTANVYTYIDTGTAWVLSQTIAGYTAATGIAFAQDSVGNDLLLVTDTSSNLVHTLIFNGSQFVAQSNTAVATAIAYVITYTIDGVLYATTSNRLIDSIFTANYIAAGTALTGINLSAATSYSQVASIIQSAFISAGVVNGTVVYNSTANAFIVSNGDDSGAGTVTYSPVTPLATALGLTEAGGAVLSQGSVALTPAQNLAGYTSVTRDWFAFTHMWDVSSDTTYADTLAFTSWVNDQDNQYAYVEWTTEANLIIPSNTNNVAYALVDAGFGTVVAGQVAFSAPIMANYGEIDVAGMIMGTAASIDYNAANGTLSFAYKSQSGIIPLVTTDNAYTALLANGFNFYGIFDSRANAYNFTQNGSVGGIYKWFDFLCNQGWLANDIQDTVATFMGGVNKVDNNQQGYSQLASIINGVAQQGLANGVITAGNLFSNSQTAILKQQSGGIDVAKFLTSKGWFLQIVAPTPDERADRVPPRMTFWYSNSGSIVTLTINTTLVF